jgi:hypothetical protein
MCNANLRFAVFGVVFFDSTIYKFLNSTVGRTFLSAKLILIKTTKKLKIVTPSVDEG